MTFAPACWRGDTNAFIPLIPPTRCQLTYDSVHGRFPGTVSASSDGTHLVVDGKAVAWFSEKDPAKIPWGASGADYVCESTGVFVDTVRARTRSEQNRRSDESKALPWRASRLRCPARPGPA